MEYWSVGFFPITPPLQYSNTPLSSGVKRIFEIPNPLEELS